MNDEDDDSGLVCPHCNEWFEVITNRYGLGLCYCPCCGEEWNGEEKEIEK